MLRIIAGIFLLLLGLLVFLGNFVSTKDYGLAVDLIFLLVFAAPAILGGLFLIRSSMKRSKKAQIEMETKRHKEILKLAIQKGGILTMPEIISETSLSIDEAESSMKQLISRHFVEMKFKEDGVIVYEFFEIQQSTGAKSPEAHIDHLKQS